MNILNKFKEERFRVKVILGILGLIILVGICRQYFMQKNISEHKEETIGKVIDFESINMRRYSLKYEYSIGDNQYQGEIGVSYFECDNGKKGCVGQEFPVYYSSENPQYSRIDLGKYEKYKTTVEFVK
ncbi:DUF3592 domain-containing protein [Pseudozobellia thermophila]|uniref:Uncharacterized protein n=1 Tax=Pseudozobellia thermophila TaxID=192903 RepID=A0A1M6P5M2_9FLAO|nr:DUF3592 domain-containing protein [Pseudozobellia thermophila]SHK03287.1 hypothetical protein SAMN04488513_11822 [Pseudozobellia thermophila]